jgi:hypothetical protein
MILRNLEGDLSWCRTTCRLLLFLKFFAAGFDGDCQSDLGLLLGRCQFGDGENATVNTLK